MGFSAILIMSILTESIITYIKTFVVDRKIKWQMIAAVVLSIAVCLAYSLDIPALVGIESNLPYVGNIITGILVSRGSNYVYDIFTFIKSKGNEAKI